MTTSTTTSTPGLYPSTKTRKTLSASQRAILNHSISNFLVQALNAPPEKLDIPGALLFVSSYASDAAFQTLQSLIWEKEPLSKEDQTIRKRVLVLAEKLVESPACLESQTLLDIAIIYAPNNSLLGRSVFVSSLEKNPSLLANFESEVVPAFTSLLSSAQSGLHALRKTAHCLSSLMYVSPPKVVRPFSSNKAFVLALAKTYDAHLASIARSYGELNVADDIRKPDEWERLWVETKVDLMDSFHILIGQMLKDFTLDSAEQTFDILFDLLSLPSPSPSTSTPFLNQSLIQDYQQSYDLSNSVASILRPMASEDARVELLEFSLREFNLSQSGEKDPGALRLLLGSSGVPTDTGKSTKGTWKGKAKAEPTDVDPYLIKVTQVLDVLPHHSPAYIRALLQHPSFPFRDNPEKVIEALLDGTAPGPDEIGAGDTDEGAYVEYSVDQRHNIWDEEVMDLSRVKVGKNTYVHFMLLKFNYPLFISLLTEKIQNMSFAIERSSNK
jgi:activating signal cointegrator complex subunit 2